ncbi:hypothetical protein C3B59_11815 [Cryobacterium zongtaii]|uniref:Uncharacterized protein n=1 Tax=Cryobacterium zongtaii TaxID=1259217 RepID=A0A2S3Z9I3_9MICO|nr:hypothetical protein [Cryobacterium zongtaii]POH62204.1 hypothetical protein C3B59_11815 [Cryobacterium zongtaii]
MDRRQAVAVLATKPGGKALLSAAILERDTDPGANYWCPAAERALERIMHPPARTALGRPLYL